MCRGLRWQGGGVGRPRLFGLEKCLIIGMGVQAIKAVKEDALLIGETWKDGRHLLRGDQMDSGINYLLRDVVVGYFAHQTLGSWQLDNQIGRMQCLET